MEGSPEGVIVGVWAQAGADASHKAQTKSSRRERMQDLWGGGLIGHTQRVQEEGQGPSRLLEVQPDYLWSASRRLWYPPAASEQQIGRPVSRPCSSWLPPRSPPPASDRIRRQPEIVR